VEFIHLVSFAYYFKTWYTDAAVPERVLIGTLLVTLKLWFTFFFTRKKKGNANVYFGTDL